MLYSQDSAIGKEIDGYQVLDVLGRGGMGVVYKAEDVALSRLVALKMIDPALAHDEAFLRRFRAEARALARIDSPYIVGIHALRQTPVGVFIVMEYVDGGTVHDLRTPTPWAQALPLIKQMITALDHAHSVGVIHRDIKPRNIMLTKSGTVKVTDFGLAKLNQAEKQATVTQGIAGTLYYMSPEQVKGLATLDHRSDLYSLGMTLYEMLAGRLPFDKDASEFSTMRMIVEDKLPSPDQFQKSIPAPLVKIIMKALEKDPARRYQSASEMLAAIEAFSAGPGRRASAPDDDATRTFSSRPLTSARGAKKRVGLTAAAAVLVAVLALAGYLFISQSGEAPPPVQAEMSLITNPPGARVYFNGRHIGETPVQRHLVDGGQVDVHVEMDGFAPVDTMVLAEAGTPLALNLTLAQVQDVVAVEDNTSTTRTAQQLPVSDTPREPERTPPVATASLILRTVGSGSAKLDGRPVTGAQSVQAGRPHQVACGDGAGAAVETVTLTPGQTREMTCYFQAGVNIVSQGSTWGAIWINGHNTGELAPYSTTLSAGTYRISVRRDGYDTVEEKTLEIRPSLEPKMYPVSIELRPQASDGL